MSKAKVKNKGLGRGLGSLLGSSINEDNSLILKEKSKTIEKDQSSSTESQEALKKELELKVRASSLPTKKTEKASESSPVSERIVEKIIEKPVIQEKIVERLVEKKLPEGARVWRIAIDKLKPNRFQPRQVFEGAKLEELADSIREQGILQPIVARKHQDGKSFEIISGERRWRAAQLAGKHDVPVIIRSVEDQQSLELALIENIQRANLNPIEEAEAYQRLAEEYSLTQADIAKKVGKDRSSVTNALRVLSLPQEVKDLLGEQKISMGHAKALLSIEDPVTQKAVAKRIATEKLSVRQIEALAKSGRQVKPQTIKKEELDVFQSQIKTLVEDLQKNLGTKVNIDYSNGKGKIGLFFHNDGQFDELIERLKI